ncbi:hypothetical protein [Paenibacillus senegalimassiliensis]|uniref:hypothetical protein n=1 Tax=Paenibacillus senegalimassiliensis TaxID=1737426 RepID=UPI000B0C1F3B|nr:hypothetical protein [Paenibacillus senegalimassiliensis]
MPGRRVTKHVAAEKGLAIVMAESFYVFEPLLGLWNVSVIKGTMQADISGHTLLMPKK